MPEGPECRIIAEGLNKELAGSPIHRLEILSGRYNRHGVPQGWIEFNGEIELLPLVCEAVKVKGKFIYFTFQNSTWSLWNTLGMSGCWLKERTDDGRVRLCYGENQSLFFTDQRNFGTIKLVNDRTELEKKLNSLGLDLLNNDVPPLCSLELFKLKRNQHKTLAEILMNQKNYAGVGNYIKAEALYRARLSPHRIGSSLSSYEIIELHKRIQDVIRSSYAARGVSMRDYRDVDGQLGQFKKIVYGQQTDPLGNIVVQEETKDKRTTHWVPAIQK